MYIVYIVKYYIPVVDLEKIKRGVHNHIGDGY